ncbi:MAG TPA: Ig domain-containing protein [Syntrophobacteraceae bacterium]|nr:Ig domain-containing protein [Syntrophobacteraceae bacterium]
MPDSPARRFLLCMVLLVLPWGLVSCAEQEPPVSGKKESQSQRLPARPVEGVESARQAGPAPAPGTAPSTEGPRGAAPTDSLAIEEVSIEPAFPVTGESLSVVVKAKGLEGSFTDLTYSWRINGQVVQESTSDKLEKPVFRGDYVEVLVSPRVSAGSVKPVTGCVVIANSAPNVQVQSQTMGSDGNYRAQLSALDPEKDPVTFSLKKGPPGMTIEATTGTIHWSPGADVKGSFPVEVSAVDSQGAEAILSYQIQVRRETMGGT